MAQKKKKTTAKKTHEEFLLEIGVEELPASFIRVENNETPKFILDFLRLLLRDFRIDISQYRVFVTPRRIVFSFPCPAYQKSHSLNTDDEKGPPEDIAIKDGKETKAFEGYIKKISSKYGFTEKKVRENIGSFTFGGKKYISVHRLQLPGKKITAIFPEIIKRYLNDVHFSKNMRWEASGVRFPRPIRWIVALYGNKIIPVTIAGIKSGNVSRGHRFLGKDKVLIKTANIDAYIKALKKESVIVDLILGEDNNGNVIKQDKTAREAMIIKQIKTKCANLDIDVDKLDKDLIKTIANLVESPAVFIGEFKKEYLKLPKEVLASSMKKHQKVLACYTKRGTILNKFIGVSNGARPAAAMKTITKNVENVLEARLRDAQFFYNEDTKTPLDEKVQKLNGIVFLGKLGTVHDKVMRLERYVDQFSNAYKTIGCDDIDNQLRVAARLCKADLVTHMVYEFPELQGLVGQHYAAHDGLGEAISSAIFEHYLPRFSGDKLPLTKIGEFLAIFDRIDTLCGAFSLGLEPTGSQDPYALRRAAIGVVRILKQSKIPLSLAELLTFGCSLFTEHTTRSGNDVHAILSEFIRDKVQFVFEETLSRDTDKELLRAAMGTSFDNIADLEERFVFLKKAYKAEPTRFIEVCKICERTQNITKGEEGLTGKVDAALLQSDLERRLYETFTKVKNELAVAFDKGELDRCLKIYHDSFHELVHEFFDKILVNVDDMAVRKNRKNLMKLINDLFTTRIADLSFIRF
ncbi:MAG: glycine--tRNA ligase subunit beta [Candidatus Omnitrophica bacterium]|nr:glycine--tRNA ligase subunit beta [Candidatus Omnitrophota bacterium]